VPEFASSIITERPPHGTVNLIGSGRDKAGEAGHTNAYARRHDTRAPIRLVETARLAVSFH